MPDSYRRNRVPIAIILITSAATIAALGNSLVRGGEGKAVGYLGLGVVTAFVLQSLGVLAGEWRRRGGKGRPSRGDR